MIQVRSVDAKAKWSAMLAHVAGGEVVTITKRGKVIATMSGAAIGLSDLCAVCGSMCPSGECPMRRAGMPAEAPKSTAAPTSPSAPHTEQPNAPAPAQPRGLTLAQITAASR